MNRCITNAFDHIAIDDPGAVRWTAVHDVANLRRRKGNSLMGKISIGDDGKDEVCQWSCDRDSDPSTDRRGHPLFAHKMGWDFLALGGAIKLDIPTQRNPADPILRVAAP